MRIPNLHKLLVSLPLVLTLPVGAAAARPQDPAPATEKPQVAAPEFDIDAALTTEEAPGPNLGGPLTVDGQEIGINAIKRFLIYGPGRNMLEARKLDVLTEQERELRKAAGEDVSRFEVTQEEFEEARKREIDQFIQRYPGLDLRIEISRAYKTVAWYERSLRQTLEFDKMFFSGNPREWPDVTKEAVYAGSPEVDLVEDAAENWERRIQYAEEKGEPVRPEDDMFMGLLRDYVIGSLKSLVEIKSASDGLPDDLVLTVEGGGFKAELTTEEMYEENKGAFTGKEVEDARKFLALMAAAEQRLEKEGFLIDDEAYAGIIGKLEGDLAESIFNLDFLAVQGHQFPSTEAYKAHMRLIESFRKRIASQLDSGEAGKLTPELQAHLEVANAIMGLARADADVLLVSAFDFPAFDWKPNGWEDALARSFELKDQIDAHLAELAAYESAKAEAVTKGENFEGEAPLSFDRYWAQLIDLESEYWDPPMPVQGKMPPMVGMKNKGRFGPKTRNDLERDIGESPYLQFIEGGSITDAIFFDIPIGSVAGPFKGPHGYYIVYLKSKTRPTNPLNVQDPKHLELLQEDYLRREFIQFAHEALDSAEVVGL